MRTEIGEGLTAANSWEAFESLHENIKSPEDMQYVLKLFEDTARSLDYLKNKSAQIEKYQKKTSDDDKDKLLSETIGEGHRIKVTTKVAGESETQEGEIKYFVEIIEQSAEKLHAELSRAFAEQIDAILQNEKLSPLQKLEELNKYWAGIIASQPKFLPKEMSEKYQLALQDVSRQLSLQITADCGALFANLNIEEFRNISALSDKKKREQVPTISAWTDYYNNLASLVTISVLDTGNASLANAMAEFWLSVAIESFKQGNFYAFNAIWSGLNSSQVKQVVKSDSPTMKQAQELFEKIVTPASAHRVNHLDIDEALIIYTPYYHTVLTRAKESGASSEKTNEIIQDISNLRDNFIRKNPIVSSSTDQQIKFANHLDPGITDSYLSFAAENIKNEAETNDNSSNVKINVIDGNNINFLKERYEKTLEVVTSSSSFLPHLAALAALLKGGDSYHALNEKYPYKDKLEKFRQDLMQSLGTDQLEFIALTENKDAKELQKIQPSLLVFFKSHPELAKICNRDAQLIGDIGRLYKEYEKAAAQVSIDNITPVNESVVSATAEMVTESAANTENDLPIAGAVAPATELVEAAVTAATAAEPVEAAAVVKPIVSDTPTAKQANVESPAKELSIREALGAFNETQSAEFYATVNNLSRGIALGYEELPFEDLLDRMAEFKEAEAAIQARSKKVPVQRSQLVTFDHNRNILQEAIKLKIKEKIETAANPQELRAMQAYLLPERGYINSSRISATGEGLMQLYAQKEQKLSLTHNAESINEISLPQAAVSTTDKDVTDVDVWETLKELNQIRNQTTEELESFELSNSAIPTAESAPTESPVSPILTAENATTNVAASSISVSAARSETLNTEFTEKVYNLGQMLQTGKVEGGKRLQLSKKLGIDLQRFQPGSNTISSYQINHDLESFLKLIDGLKNGEVFILLLDDQKRVIKNYIEELLVDMAINIDNKLDKQSPNERSIKDIAKMLESADALMQIAWQIDPAFALQLRNIPINTCNKVAKKLLNNPELANAAQALTNKIESLRPEEKFVNAAIENPILRTIVACELQGLANATKANVAPTDVEIASINANPMHAGEIFDNGGRFKAVSGSIELLNKWKNEENIVTNHYEVIHEDLKVKENVKQAEGMTGAFAFVKKLFNFESKKKLITAYENLLETKHKLENKQAELKDLIKLKNQLNALGVTQKELRDFIKNEEKADALIKILKVEAPNEVTQVEADLHKVEKAMNSIKKGAEETINRELNNKVEVKVASASVVTDAPTVTPAPASSTEPTHVPGLKVK